MTLCLKHHVTIFKSRSTTSSQDKNIIHSLKCSINKETKENRHDTCAVKINYSVLIIILRIKLNLDFQIQLLCTLFLPIYFNIKKKNHRDSNININK